MDDDRALAQAREWLTQAPLFDGHNDLAWVIRNDPKARGDVLAYDLPRAPRRATPTFRACARAWSAASSGRRSSRPTRRIRRARRSS